MKNIAMRLLLVITLLLICVGVHAITFAKRYGCDTLFQVGNYLQLEKVHETILLHLEQAKKRSDFRETAAMYGLASESLMALGQYKNALEHAQKGAGLYKKLLATTSGNTDFQLNYDYALVLNNMAQLNTHLLNNVSETIEFYKETATQFLKCAEIVSKTKNINHADMKRFAYAEYLLYKSSAMLDLLGHNFSGSVEGFEQSLNKLKEIYPKSTTTQFEYLQTLLMISEVYSRVQNHEVSIQYAQQAISLLKQSFGTENMYYVNAMYLLGSNYYMLNDLVSAGTYLTRSMEAYDKTGHLKHADFALVLEAMGSYFMSVAEYETAENLYDLALDIITYSCGDDCFHVYANRFIATYPMQYKSQFKKASNQLENIISQENFYSNLASDHLICAWNSYFEIALLTQNYDDIFKNEVVVNELVQILDCPENLNVSKLYTNIGRAYQRKGQYKAACHRFFKALDLTRLMTYRNFSFLPEEQRVLYWERDKSRFESILRLNAATNNNGHNDLAEILFDASLLQKSLQLNASANMAQIIDNKGSEELKMKMRRLQLMMNSVYSSDDPQKIECFLLEKQVQDEARKLGDFMDFANYTWQDVKKALGETDVAIEFVSERWTNGINISAEILRSDMDTPYHLHLFSYNAKSLTDEVIAEGLRKSIENKLLRFLKPGCNVYFAPSGELHKIPMEYMQMSNGKRMDELYHMHRVTSTRQLIAKENNINSNKNIALFGGLNYNSSIDDMELQAMLVTEQSRSKNNNTLWSYLPGTMKEVTTIAPMMESAAYQVSLFTQDEGVEEQLKALSESHTGIIHIATHGYYQPTSSNGMDGSGLIFAGANNFWSSLQERSKSEFDDGVLTAKEISNLNLIGTDLVVLSACQTALGDISGEGVFGLQRAFKKAGVQSLLMSLWEVDDEATQVLMTAFYQNLINGSSKHESLKNAQDKVRNSFFIRNGEKISGDNPFYWAAFVLVD